MKIHDLRTWPKHFNQLLEGKKTFDIRRNDRDFHVEDLVIHNEYDPSVNDYSGRVIIIEITHAVQDFDIPPEYGFTLPAGVIIMSIKVLSTRGC